MEGGSGPEVKRRETFLWPSGRTERSRDSQGSGDLKGAWRNHLGGMETWDRRR